MIHLCNNLVRITCTIKFIQFLLVDSLSKIVRTSLPNKMLNVQTFKLPSEDNLKTFIDKYDQIQDKLVSITAMDDLLAGKIEYTIS